MPLQKKFDSYPYFDDYEESKDYYKVLFKPGVAVQARELNQLQTILQRQVEHFGNHIFKSGTVVSGINFSYNSQYNYAKILDVETDGRPVAPSTYVGLLARNSANLVSRVINYKEGFQSRDPDLNTIYLAYLNSGASGTESQYSNNEVLTIYGSSYPLYGITINSPGLSFANTDDVVITSAIKVNLLSTVPFQNAETIIQATTGTRLEIIEAIDNGDSTQQILLVKPLNSDLANTSAPSSTWELSGSYNIAGSTTGATATIAQFYGTGARGIATTDTLGIVRSITVASQGSGYEYPPHITIRPQTTPSADLENLILVARNFKAKVTVAGEAFSDPVGIGYAFSITEGVIYQKGYFSRVTPQTVIVSKYTNQPDGLVVGFTTDEANVGATFDSSLYDNAANTSNYRAPGADRLKLTPTLKVVSNTAAESNTVFFPLVEFEQGRPSREYRDTQYNQIAQEFERRTRESAGDYVIDPFYVTTKEIEGNTTHFSAVIDPGTAYISGARVKTINNSFVPVPKVSETIIRSNTILTASYGNYVVVNELAGNFDFKTAQTVALYDTGRTALSSIASGVIAPTGSQIGTARVRSLVHESGEQGIPSTTYRVYLFDIQMNQGKYFENVKSLYYNGTNKGVCDIVQSFITTSNRAGSVLQDNVYVDSVFDIGTKGVKSITNVAYNYRTSNEGLTVADNGTMSIAAPSGYTFPYSAGHVLTNDEKRDFTLIPLAKLVANAPLAATVTNNGLNLVFTTSTSVTSYLQAGDYIDIDYSGTPITRRIVSVDASSFTVNAVTGIPTAGGSIKLVFPQNVPINMNRSGRSIATRPGSGGNATVDIDLGTTLTTAQSIIGFYTIYIPSATRVSKTVNRNAVVKINTSTHTSGATGPWSLGVTDVIRLKGVYEGTTTSGVNVTKHFFVDDGGRGDMYRLASLVKRPTSQYSTTGKQFVVVFDCFTPSSGLEGFYTINSYPIDDTKTLGDSTATINTLEVPELLTSQGRYYDLRDTFDFRPVAINTTSITTDPGSAATNPGSSVALNTDEKYFPVPGSSIYFDSEMYLSRADSIVVRKAGDFGILKGAALDTAAERNAPETEPQSLLLNKLIVPKYPCLPQILSRNTLDILDRSVGNERGVVNNRRQKYNVRSTLNANIGTAVQPRGYSMKRIGALERRVQVLEQFATLTAKENSIKNLSVASSIDPTKQRFKNGFIVDSFDKNTSADTSNKEYNAFVVENQGVLMPSQRQRLMSLEFNTSDFKTAIGVVGSFNTLMLPFKESKVISFAVGTVPYVPPAISVAPAVTPSPSVSVAPSRTPAISATPMPSNTPGASPTPTPSPTPSMTRTPSPTSTPTPTPTPTRTAGATPSPTPSPTYTPTPSPSLTPPTSPGITPSPTPSVTSSPLPTPSPTPTLTPVATPTPTPSITPPVTPGATPSPTPSITPTPTPTPSNTPAPSASPIGTPAPTPSVTPPVTASPTPTPTPTPTFTATSTPTPSPTRTPAATPTPTPTITPTITPTATPTRTPSATVTPTPSPTPTRTPGATPTPSVTPTPTPSQTPGITPSPTPSLTPPATATATPTPTPTFTPTPTYTPTNTPTPSPTRTPPVTPGVTPTSTPTPSPTRTPPASVSPAVTPTPSQVVVTGGGGYYDSVVTGNIVIIIIDTIYSIEEVPSVQETIDSTQGTIGGELFVDDSVSYSDSGSSYSGGGSYSGDGDSSGWSPLDDEDNSASVY